MGHGQHTWAGTAYAADGTGQSRVPSTDKEDDVVPAATEPSPAAEPVTPEPASPVALEATPAAARPPATRGWRAGVRRITGGLIAPRMSSGEAAELADQRAILAAFAGTKTVVVANPKGGAGKSPTCVGLASTFGDVRGGGVLAWDNNETLGTLGIRTESGGSTTSAVDLLANLSRFERVGARRGDLNAFVRRQDAHFDVLVSDEDPRRMTQIGHPEFRRLHDILGRYYDLMVVDTGNNIRADNFLSSLISADMLVIPVRWADDVVISATRLCAQVSAVGFESLVRGAVTVITGSPSPAARPEQVRTWRSWFEQTTAAVVEIPYDPHIAAGSVISYAQLRPQTRRAYVRAAARIAEQLTVTTPNRTPQENA